MKFNSGNILCLIEQNKHPFKPKSRDWVDICDEEEEELAINAKIALDKFNVFLNKLVLLRTQLLFEGKYELEDGEIIG